MKALLINSLAIVIIVAILTRIANKHLSLTSIRNTINSDEDIERTLLIGLYYRFRREIGNYDKENPLMFESFVAGVLERFFGGSAHATKASGDFGVDIIHSTRRGKYLGQVKCYGAAQLVNYEPIAILHSQMVKERAIGGYVVTTSDFTPNAKTYAERVNIELINGVRLVKMWINPPEVMDVKDNLYHIFRLVLRDMYRYLGYVSSRIHIESRKSSLLFFLAKHKH